jgi:excisionase family DNA binding protein
MTYKPLIAPGELRAGEAAAILQLAPDTVSRWAKQGRLPHRVTPGGHRVFPAAEIQALAEALRRDDRNWRPIIGFEGFYEVSNHGEVRRIARGSGTYPGRLKKAQSNEDGYLFVCLYYGGHNRCRALLVHRAVAAAFLGPCPDGHEVNHRDGVKTNNRPANLEYATSSENGRHAYRTGLQQRQEGESNHRAKLTTEQVADIRRRYQPRIYSMARLAREFGVNKSTIQGIIAGRKWKIAGSA